MLNRHVLYVSFIIVFWGCDYIRLLNVIEFWWGDSLNFKINILCLRLERRKELEFGFPQHMCAMVSGMHPFPSSQPLTLNSRGNDVSHVFVYSKNNYQALTTILGIRVQDTKMPALWSTHTHTHTRAIRGNVNGQKEWNNCSANGVTPVETFYQSNKWENELVSVNTGKKRYQTKGRASAECWGRNVCGMISGKEGRVHKGKRNRRMDLLRERRAVLGDFEQRCEWCAHLLKFPPGC